MVNQPLVFGLFLSAGVFGAGVVSQQGQAVPGPGSGIMQVAGTVSIANAVAVTASQTGEWRMTIANTPTVAVAAPPFVKNGGRYEITWTSGEKEDVVATAVDAGGWVYVSQSGVARWINLSVARSVRQL